MIMLKIKKTIKPIIAVCFALLLGNNLSIKAQNDNSVREIEQLATEFHDAEIKWNVERLGNILTEEFQETRTDGSGVVTKPKAGIISELRGKDMPETLRKVFKLIESDRKIADFSAQPVGDKANFKYKLTERSTLKIASENQPFDLNKIERFEVSGTAVRRDGKWLLASLRKTFLPAQNKEPRRNEIDEGIKFDLALVGLMVEALQKEKFQPTNKDEQTQALIYEFYNLAINPKIEIFARLKSVAPIKNASRTLRNAPRWLQKFAAKIETLTTEIEAGYEQKIVPRLTSHKFRGQTVYQLKSTLADVLYDQKGNVLCVLQIEIKNLTAEKCRDFEVERHKGKLVWQMAEEKE